MNGIQRFCGIGAPMMRINIDTDAIIPSREMSQVSKVGLAAGLFANWRYLSADSREINPEFVLNQPPYDRAEILVAGRNFGCGSSREHAVWALKEWGIRAIIAPDYGAIFASNCINNGVLPVRLTEGAVEHLAGAVTAAPLENEICVDLYNRQVSLGADFWQFTIGDRDHDMLLRGLSAIDLTLEFEPQIEQFEADDSNRRSWSSI